VELLNVEIAGYEEQNLSFLYFSRPDGERKDIDDNDVRE
jgi:hypothetical protein